MKLEYRLSSRIPNSKRERTYRNPIIYDMELKEEIRREGLTQAELARIYGISRVRVNQ